MGKTEWYRRTTWTAKDQDEFNERLGRSRGAGNKSQYVRIQASHLAEAGHHIAALELLDRFFAEYPEEQTQLAIAHLQRAKSLQALDRIDAALNEYRAALEAEREFPNARTDAWLDFGWLVVRRQRTDLYAEVAKVLQEFGEEHDQHLTFPATRFRYFALESLLADARGNRTDARTFARRALEEAEKKHSGLRYHAQLGLVGPELRIFERKLKELAGS